MVSVQTTLYQNESSGLPAGSATRCEIELSLPGEVLPTRAACVPPCAPEATTAAWPETVQPASVPTSKSPLTTPPPLPPGVMVQAIDAWCVRVPLVPLAVTA